MEEAFGIVLFAVVGIATIIAIFSLAASRDAYRQIGRGGLTMDGDETPRRDPLVAASTSAEGQAEIRQMLEARNARRTRRGQEPVDVEAELARLTSPTHRSGVDPALREEVRQMVVARNARRARRGQEPLDVEAETERQLRELG
ncbi:MAG: hypothetical protein M3459_07105 [Actinomycetota bacterium]|nr:hypothetical protein [Actinomycetota bacterium]